ncbi:MAG: MarR family transcriptional regulator [Oscillospiraceae bacterium]|jgi:DNA-binding MarR family transcriptional regulator|nr:MarR family transcriptional regulator [Oscillospiraceae bacterium]
MRRLLASTNGGFLVSKIKQVQGRVFGKLLGQHGFSQFSGAQGRILFVLWRHDSISISELSDKTGLAKTTLTSMLDRLEALGCIKRVSDSADRRKVNIALTKAAQNLKSRYDEVSVRMNEIFYAGFSDHEMQNFENLLARVLKNLTEREKMK